MFKVRHIEDEEDGAFDNLLNANYVRRDDSFVLLTTLREYVDDLGTRMQAHWLLIDTNERMMVLRMVACFVIDISDDIAKVEAQPIMRPSTWRRLSCRWTSSRCDPRRSSPRWLSRAWHSCRRPPGPTTRTTQLRTIIASCSRRTAGRTASRRSLTSTITWRRSTRRGTRSMARDSTSCAASTLGWRPSSRTRRRSSLTCPSLNGSLMSSARVCWTCPWRESSKRNNSNYWISSGAFCLAYRNKFPLMRRHILTYHF